MGWNEPDKGKDPWKGKNQPPDLDEALKRVHDKLKKFFGGGTSKTSNEPSKKSNGGLVTLVVILIAFILWVLSGIFIVDPQSRRLFFVLANMLKLWGQDHIGYQGLFLPKSS